MGRADESKKNIHIAGDGLVKIDGITSFRKISRDGVIYIQFCDHDRMRSKCRGTRFVEVPLDILFKKLEEEKPDGSTNE